MDQRIKVGDVVTILDGSATYDVTQVSSEEPAMARIWPADPSSEQEGQWVGRDLLRK